MKESMIKILNAILVAETIACGYDVRDCEREEVYDSIVEGNWRVSVFIGIFHIIVKVKQQEIVN